MTRRFVLGLVSVMLAGCAASQQQEIQMGEQYAAQIAQQLPIIGDPEINRYINVLGDSLAKLTDRAELEWHFHVVDDKEVNAFAVPGGYIYVNRGLIERVHTMNELAGVIGHEIGHVVKRHTVKQMQQMDRANVGVVLLCSLTRVCSNQASQAGMQVGAAALFAKFSRGDEAEADAEGVKYLVNARIDPYGIPSMFQVLIDERKARPDGVESWFQNHPLEEDRIESTRALIATYPAAQLQGLAKDSENFQTFKRRLMAMPPSPPPRNR